MDTQKSFGDTVRAYRKARGLSRQELSDRVDGRGEGKGTWLNAVERHGQLPGPKRLARLLEVIRGAGPPLPGFEEVLKEVQAGVDAAVLATIEAEGQRRAQQAKQCVIRRYEKFLSIIIAKSLVQLALDSPTPNV